MYIFTCELLQNIDNFSRKKIKSRTIYHSAASYSLSTDHVAILSIADNNTHTCLMSIEQGVQGVCLPHLTYCRRFWSFVASLSSVAASLRFYANPRFVNACTSTLIALVVPSRLSLSTRAAIASRKGDGVTGRVPVAIARDSSEGTPGRQRVAGCRSSHRAARTAFITEHRVPVAGAARAESWRVEESERGSERDSLASSWVSLPSRGAERRRWLAVRRLLPSRSIGVAAAAGFRWLCVRRRHDTRVTVGGKHGAHSRTWTSRRAKRARERARAFLKRDSRTGADTPPPPRIFRPALPLPRSHSLSPSLPLSRFPPAAYPPLSLTLARSRACALSLGPPAVLSSVPRLPRASRRRRRRLLSRRAHSRTREPKRRPRRNRSGGGMATDSRS